MFPSVIKWVLCLECIICNIKAKQCFALWQLTNWVPHKSIRIFILTTTLVSYLKATLEENATSAKLDYVRRGRKVIQMWEKSSKGVPSWPGLRGLVYFPCSTNSCWRQCSLGLHRALGILWTAGQPASWQAKIAQDNLRISSSTALWMDCLSTCPYKQRLMMSEETKTSKTEKKKKSAFSVTNTLCFPPFSTFATWISAMEVVWGQGLTVKISENQCCLSGQASFSPSIRLTTSAQGCRSARHLLLVSHIPSLSCLTKLRLFKKPPTLHGIFGWQDGAGATARAREWSLWRPVDKHTGIW